MWSEFFIFVENKRINFVRNTLSVAPHQFSKWRALKAKKHFPHTLLIKVACEESSLHYPKDNIFHFKKEEKTHCANSSSGVSKPPLSSI